MDNNEEDRIMNSSSVSPILDVIDLTNESPIKATHSCRRYPKNKLASSNNIPTNSNQTSIYNESASSSDKTFVLILLYLLLNKVEIIYMYI